MGSRGGLGNSTRDDGSSRGRIRSRSGPYYRAFASTDGTKAEYSHDDERALQEIDKDITRIWRELQELDGMAPARNDPSMTSFQQKPERNQDRDHVLVKNLPTGNIKTGTEPKPKYETVTVREFTMPTPVAASPTRIRSVSSSTSHALPSRSKDDTKDKQPEIEKSEGKPRTIWDMDCSEPLDPNHVPNYSTPSRRSRDTTQRSGLVKPSWRRSLSGSRNPYDDFSKYESSKSTAIVNKTSTQSQAFGPPFSSNITPIPVRRTQQSKGQSPSPPRPVSSSPYIPSPHSSSTCRTYKNSSDISNKKPTLLLEKSVQPIEQR